MSYREGTEPVEVNRASGSRKVIDGCPNCYYFAYPCGQCKGKTEIMTYSQFRQIAVNGEKDPEKYEDFLKDENNPHPTRYV